MIQAQILHTAAVGLGNLRIFRAPFDEPHLPWHSVDDLLRCMALGRNPRRVCRAEILADFPGETHTIATETGKTLIASHLVAHTLIHTLEDQHVIPSGFLENYAEACGEAMAILKADLSPLENINFVVEAFRRTHGIPGPHPKVGPDSILQMPRGAA